MRGALSFPASRQPHVRTSLARDLYTFGFQAPAFYRSLGYTPVHTLRGYPQGILRYLMTKQLGAPFAPAPCRHP